MRALILLVVGLNSSWAAAKSVLTVAIHDRYSVRMTDISSEGPIWVCVSEVLPYYESSTIPFDESSLDYLFQDYAKKPAYESCAQKITITDRRGKKDRTLTTCVEQRDLKNFVERLHKACGR